MFRSAKYREFVRSKQCICPGCRRQADHAHHFDRSCGGGGTSLKPHDTYIVPLCAEHHREVHCRATLVMLTVEETRALFYVWAFKNLTEWVEQTSSEESADSRMEEVW